MANFITRLNGEKIIWIRVSSQNPCPICRKPDWCGISAGGNKVLCTRIESEQEHANAYIHHLTENVAVFAEEVVEESLPLQKVNLRHKVYSIVADFFGLTEEDQQHLTNVRGLSEETIAMRKYFSTSELNRQIKDGTIRQEEGKVLFETVWNDLFKENNLPEDVWKGVAGFYSKHGMPVFETKKGIAIPCRNRFGQIIGLQLRVSDVVHYAKFEKVQDRYNYYVSVSQFEDGYTYRVTEKSSMKNVATGTVQEKNVFLQDLNLSFKIESSAKYIFVSSLGKENGTKAESVPHYAFTDTILEKASFDDNGSGRYDLLTELPKKNIVVTEGYLKGDIIASHIPSTKLANLSSDVVVSIAGVSSWKQMIGQLKKYGLKNVFVAFDQDFTDNDTVYKNMCGMVDGFDTIAEETYVLTWDLGKGLDDCLLAEAADTVVIN